MMNKLYLLPVLLISLTLSTFVNASPQIETSDNKLVVETSNGRVEINNGNIFIRGFNNLSENNRDLAESEVLRDRSNSNLPQTNRSSVSTVQSNFSYSSNTIDIDRSNVSEAHVLSLKSPVTLTGTISLDGKVIREISTTTETIDLAGLLSSGKHQVKIEVSAAANEMVEMTFKSPNNSIQHSSNSKLNHTLNLIVR